MDIVKKLEHFKSHKEFSKFQRKFSTFSLQPFHTTFDYDISNLISGAKSTEQA